MTLEPGKTYRIKLSNGSWTDGKFERQHTNEGNKFSTYGVRKATKRYHFTNLRTGREIVLKSLVKVKEIAK